MVDLELVSDEALLDELAKRSDALSVVVVRFVKDTESEFTHYQFGEIEVLFDAVQESVKMLSHRLDVFMSGGQDEAEEE